MTSPHTPAAHGEDEPRGLVGLVDELLELIGDVIHDGPVQQLVAAKLLVESAMPAATRTELEARAITSMASASQQSRVIMWALARPGVRPRMAHVDVPQALSKLEGASITVDVPDSVPAPVLGGVVQAVHHLCGGSVMAGHEVTAVELTHSGTTLSCRIVVDGPGPAAVWVDLARHRLAALGGAVEVDRREGATIVTVHAPSTDHPTGHSGGQSIGQPG
ncbi:hypothetical protein [Euzebya tangerina]|uniref:hypothetical protein n=1 Tax=Euzebya tangerina TaxID=591198 RepID=UPI000E31AB79|nr:hypothetical protein [Euzebya tangerina]